MSLQERDEVKVFAPASVSNIGPGFDVFGMAVHHPGDMVVARRTKRLGVRIIAILNDDGELPMEAHKNTAGVAAEKVLELVGGKGGVDLELYKGMPSQSGLGSSGASAAAAAFAVNLLYGGLLSKEELVGPCVEAEAMACGSGHADNVAPSLIGGFVVVQNTNPLQVHNLRGIEEMYIVLVHPNIDVPTRMARAAVPKKVEMGLAVQNWANTALMAHAFATGDLRRFCSAVVDPIVEPCRANFIPGFYEIREAAMSKGAWACSISGSGPTMFAIVPQRELQDPVGEAMKEAFAVRGIKSQVYATSLNNRGTVAIEVN